VICKGNWNFCKCSLERIKIAMTYFKELVWNCLREEVTASLSAKSEPWHTPNMKQSAGSPASSAQGEAAE
jgi:hypothetical protein